MHTLVRAAQQNPGYTHCSFCTFSKVLMSGLVEPPKEMNDSKNPTNHFQEVCKMCGFCCDGTLFKHASLLDDEVNENFQIIENPNSGKRHFVQPCPHHAGICTLDLDNRASICSSFKCKLLKKLDTNELDTEQAHEIVGQTKFMINELDAELKYLNEDIKGTIHEKFNMLKKAEEARLHELGLPTSQGALSVKYGDIQEILNRHFRPKKHHLNDDQ